MNSIVQTKNNEDDLLLKRLLIEYDSIVHPGYEKLLSSESYDESEIEYLDKYEHCSWLKIDDFEIDRNWESIFFLSDDGLKFVLPAMLRMLINFDETDRSDWLEPLSELLRKKIIKGFELTDEQKTIANEIILSAYKKKNYREFVLMKKRGR